MTSKCQRENDYSTRPATTVSWCLPHAVLSFDLIRRIAPAAAIIDAGYSQLTVLA
ncbi:hypothetical protein [Aromatoleum petrolei]|uniref:Uncharacterized protein n=1 Tax=Aromatoleum petrolei TaxID=76116 RepID=A0ABX1MZP6_9RHOO|nr:hypothetical protein [Aromatoleum petrolei]NMF91404.1 hypothetical protein [Aromatoleum petrolei]QTQ34617.1 Uncharacterized protein ToN1_04460 [Aromatoleum petrolei]